MNAPRWLNVAVSAVLAAVAPGCDYVATQELKPGVSTAAEVRSRMGLPTQEFQNPDGTTTLEFSRQPNGVECYMVTIGPDQIMRKIEQVLTEENLARIVAGMDRDDVSRRLGTPGTITMYKNGLEEVWDWRVAGMMPTEEAHFHVHFDTATGFVKTTSRRVEPRA